jgi:hypothetical protein
VNWLTLLAPQALLVRVGAVTLLAVAIFCFGWVKGAGQVEMEWSKQTAELGRAHDAEVSRLALTQAKVEIRYVERIKTVKHAAEVITKEVPLYVTQTDNARCTIPDGFVSLLNRAAQSGVPRADSPAIVDDPATVARAVTR